MRPQCKERPDQTLWSIQTSVPTRTPAGSETEWRNEHTACRILPVADSRA